MAKNRSIACFYTLYKPLWHLLLYAPERASTHPDYEIFAYASVST